ncbi:hypothetical protein M405DRAFT_830394 [Rhizopogon salebrosus TDB-379]|nr:hypothetical protein M405DRAFT_830394 [Rhizopogon salebrosus TDB-379]
MIQVRRGSSLVLDWKQSSGTLLIDGDSRIIRVWDAHTETQVLDLDTNFSADGLVKLFDRRLEEEDAIVRSYHGHHSWVQNVKYHPCIGGRFLSASLAGEVHLWDARGSNNAAQSWDLHHAGLSTFDVYPQTGVFATTSALTLTNFRYQHLMIHPISDSPPLTTLNLPSGLSMYSSRPPSPYIPRYTSFAFHLMEMLYAIGQPDVSVKTNGCKLV